MDAAGSLYGQSRHHIAQVGVRVVPINARRLDQTHDRCRPLARTQAASEEPVVTTNGNGLDPAFHPVVVRGHLPVIEAPRQRLPAPQFVVQRFGACRTLGQPHEASVSS